MKAFFLARWTAIMTGNVSVRRVEIPQAVCQKGKNMSIRSHNSHKTHLLVECAIMVALGTVLSLIKIYEAPFGGAVTLLSMAPIIVLSMRRGVKIGLPAAFVYAVLQLILGLGNVAWVPSASGKLLCILLDYIIAFSVLGLAGFAGKIPYTKNEKTNLWIGSIVGTLVVVLLRFACHLLSGVVIWYALDLEWYADDPTHIVHKYGMWMFSLVYNGWFMVPEILETVIGVPILTRALARFRV